MDLNVRGGSGGLRKPIRGDSRTCSSAPPKTAIRIKVMDMHAKIIEMLTIVMEMQTKLMGWQDCTQSDGELFIAITLDKKLKSNRKDASFEGASESDGDIIQPSLLREEHAE